MGHSFPTRWFRFKQGFNAWIVEALPLFVFRLAIAIVLGSLLTAGLCIAFGEIRWEYFFGGYVGAILIVWGIAFWLALGSI